MQHIAGWSQPIQDFQELRPKRVGSLIVRDVSEVARGLGFIGWKDEVMFAWESWMDESMLAALLPGAATRFARPVAHALVVFLQGLSPNRQAEIVAAQAALPWDSTPAQRLTEFARCCPVLHKLGQVLARDPRLAEELRIQLQSLETMQSRFSLEQIEQGLEAELGPLAARHIQLTGPPLAEASVAVVTPYQIGKQGPGPGTGEGVFKLLKPGIEERLREELELLERVGADLDARCDELQIPALDYRDAFQQVREKLIQETRLDQEQRHLRQAREIYANDPQVMVPEPFLEHCTPRLTAMQRVRGVKITEHGFRIPQYGQQLAERVTRLLLAEPLLSNAATAVFHGDPHAGNLLLTPRGQIAVLDWSLVGRLETTEREVVMQILMAACLLDRQQIVKQLQRLAGPRPLALEALHRLVQNRLERLRQGQFPGLTWLIGLLDEAAQQAHLRVSSDLFLLRKAVHSLQGVTWELGGAGHQVDETLMKEFFVCFLAEWPLRWWTLPHSRDFATRLSNFDLTRFFWSLPWAATRYRQADQSVWANDPSHRSTPVN